MTCSNLIQVLSKEREIQRTREIKEDFNSRIHDISEKLKAISAKFKEKSPDVDHAKEEVKVGHAADPFVSEMLELVLCCEDSK